MADLRKELELRKRLGIRYLDPAAPVQAPAGPERAPEEMDGKEGAPPADGPGAPFWMTRAFDSVEAMELTAFDRDIRDCQNCPLGSTRKRFVFGSGNPQAEMMFIGEAPGADEDAQGLPFVGKAGQLLTKIIESTQTWKRDEVFICNVLKCRPPGNRTPLPEEVDQCRPYLEEQIRIVRPRMIVALGASAAQALLRTRDAVGKLRNQWHEVEGIPLRVTYHPAALLRFEGYKKDVWADMKEITKKYLELKGEGTPG